MRKEILVIDDDQLMRSSLSFHLENAGYRVQRAASAEEALKLLRTSSPDLILLDIGLPGMDGLEALRYLKQQHVPVILLTARRRELDEVLGLEVGADDYITKPFSQDVLLARIRRVLRRAAQRKEAPRELAPVRVGNLTIDPLARRVTLDHTPVELTPRAFDLLYALAAEAGRAIPLEDLLASVWGPAYAGETHLVYPHIRWLRQKLEEDASAPLMIQTVRGVGYKLVPREREG
ncbi:MAG: response regulator transcription factor [Chloroflexota bacterium]|nr:response regulator transcription factor [Chloroflexota bacterium]